MGTGGAVFRTNEFILQADVCDYGLLRGFGGRGRDNGGSGNEQAGEEGSEGAHGARVCEGVDWERVSDPEEMV